MASRTPPTDATTRFSQRVNDYVRYRPTYPPAMLDCLRDEFGLRPEHVVADIGAGTGIWSEILLKNGNAVFAVEPNAPMREAAERVLAGYPSFRSVAGTAEATTLQDASCDWVTAAQAFHWFDVDRSAAEFRRILRPGGRVALFWNNRLEHSPFLREYEALMQDVGTDYSRIKHQGVEIDGSIERFFGSGCFTLRTFANRQDLDLDGLRGRTLSASYVPRPGQPGFDAMIASLRAMFDRHEANGRVELEYETRLYVGQLNAP